MQNPNLWKDKEKAVKVTKELSDLQQEVSEFEAIKTEEDLRKIELRIFLPGEHDRGNAILSIFSGAGGQDAQDCNNVVKNV